MAIMANCDSGHGHNDESRPAYDSGNDHEDDENLHIIFLSA